MEQNLENTNINAESPVEAQDSTNTADMDNVPQVPTDASEPNEATTEPSDIDSDEEDTEETTEEESDDTDDEEECETICIACDENAAIALALSPFDNIAVFKFRGQLRIRKLCHRAFFARIFGWIKSLFVSREN